MLRRSLSVLVIGVVLVVMACDAKERRQPPPVPSAHPVVESAPYLCDLVPERSFRQAVGITAPLEVRWSGRPRQDHAMCSARVAGEEAALGMRWSFNDGENIIRTQRGDGDDPDRRDLPPDLGDGLTALDGDTVSSRDNYVIALFHCGKKKPWIRIDFVPVVRGRDAVQDMTDFMRIAQKRFGEIHKCAPRPR
ncbi:hypothetical protein ACFVH6_00630 [Spirillospora sp. NPDC127200]